MIDRLLTFPFPQICRHNVACTLLDILERHGYPVSTELAGAVVRAEDEIALTLLTMQFPLDKTDTSIVYLDHDNG